jgi:hypothetical protein
MLAQRQPFGITANPDEPTRGAGSTIAPLTELIPVGMIGAFALGMNLDEAIRPLMSFLWPPKMVHDGRVAMKWSPTNRTGFHDSPLVDRGVKIQVVNALCEDNFVADFADFERVAGDEDTDFNQEVNQLVGNVGALHVDGDTNCSYDDIMRVIPVFVEVFHVEAIFHYSPLVRPTNARGVRWHYEVLSALTADLEFTRDEQDPTMTVRTDASPGFAFDHRDETGLGQSFLVLVE